VLSCVFNPNHVPVKPPIGLADYVALPHVAVTFTNSLQVCFAAALDEIGTELNVVGASSEFLSELATIAAAPVITTIPPRMARQDGPRFGLTLSPVPLAAGGLDDLAAAARSRCRFGLAQDPGGRHPPDDGARRLPPGGSRIAFFEPGYRDYSAAEAVGLASKLRLEGGIGRRRAGLFGRNSSWP
jgi:hypothetical protein